MSPALLPLNADLSEVLPKNAMTWVSACSAQSQSFGAMVEASAQRLGAPCYVGIFIGGLNNLSWAATAGGRLLTFFLTPEAKALGSRTIFLPLCYADIADYLGNHPPHAALIMVSPPNANGLCSLGTCVDFIADIWRTIPVRIAHINPLMPRTLGDPGIPFEEFSAYFEAAQPLLTMIDAELDQIYARLAGHVASLVPDGATLQTGIGKLPGAVLHALTSHRKLAFHSGLIGDAVIDLAQAGALRSGPAVTAGVAIGTPKLYEHLGGPVFRFAPPSITHAPLRIGAIKNFVAINSAIEVDLFGQAYAEVGPRGFNSGPGGALEFARGARLSNGGLRILVLPSTAKKRSRIIAPPGGGPVSLGRMDTDFVVTENGVADLRGRSHSERAEALVSIAAPEHQQNLVDAWRDLLEQQG